MEFFATLLNYCFVSTRQAPATPANPGISFFSLVRGGMLNTAFHPCAETDSPARLSPSRVQAGVAKTPADAQPGPTSIFFHYTVLKLAEQEVAFLSGLSRDQRETAGSRRVCCEPLTRHLNEGVNDGARNLPCSQ